MSGSLWKLSKAETLGAFYIQAGFVLGLNRGIESVLGARVSRIQSSTFMTLLLYCSIQLKLRYIMLDTLISSAFYFIWDLLK